MNLILILILLLIIIYTNKNNFIEKFDVYQTFQSFIPIDTYKFPFYPSISSNWFSNFFIPYSNGYTNLPWWNSRLGNTRNMSYDLRGDPLIIQRTNFLWNNGSQIPIYNRGI